ncbi:MAG: M56 family metallopeptidase [Phycisphaerae bacterium]
MQPIAQWMINTAFSSSLVLLLGFLVMRIPRSPAVRQRVGEAFMFGLLLAALVAAAPLWPHWTLPVVRLPANPILQPAAADGHIGLLGANGAVGGLAVAATSLVQGGNASLAMPAVTTVAHWLATALPAALVIAYLAGCALMVIRLVWGHCKLSQLVGLSAYPPPGVLELWHDLAARADRSRVQLLVAPGISSAMTFGVRKPVVMIPEELCHEQFRKHLRFVLQHELVHVRRRDALTGLASAIAGVLFFYQPMFWLVRRDIRRCQEFTADRMAAGKALRGDYATCLLDLVKLRARPVGQMMGASQVLASRSDFYARMRRLLSKAGEMEPGDIGRRWIISGTAVLLLPILVLSSITICTYARPAAAAEASSAASDWANGGSAAAATSHSTAALHRGIEYLLHRQGRRGQWLGHIGPAVTALVVKALVGAGYLLQSPPVKRGLEFIEDCRHSDGGFYADVEPQYNTAIVLSVLRDLPTEHYQSQVADGIAFLHRADGAGSIAANQWFSGGQTTGGRPQCQSDWQLHHMQLDAHERSTNQILDNYGLLSYAQLKSLVYARLTPGDLRVRRLRRWLASHYTLRCNPAEGGARGQFYYYLVFARILAASHTKTFTGASGQVHDWRNDLLTQLADMQRPDGSWVNTRAAAWLEGRPVMVTTYAVLAIERAMGLH